MKSEETRQQEKSRERENEKGVSKSEEEIRKKCGKVWKIRVDQKCEK